MHCDTVDSLDTWNGSQSLINKYIGNLNSLGSSSKGLPKRCIEPKKQDMTTKQHTKEGVVDAFYPNFAKWCMNSSLRTNIYGTM